MPNLGASPQLEWRYKMVDRSKDWFAQAERDLDHARSSQKEGRHEWACFAAQQSAEKAIKALHLWNNPEQGCH
jgi:HEPN domain-containing protein